MRRAFTFIELCIGLVVTSLVMGAAAAFMLTTSSVWHASEDAQATAQATVQMKGRLQSILRESAAIGALETGTGANPAAALIWRADSNGDGQVQTSETAILYHENATKSLVLLIPSSSSSGSTWTADAFYQPATLNSIRSGNMTSHVLMRRVSGACFSVLRPTSTVQRTLLEYDVTTTTRTGTERHYGTVALRTPVNPN